MAVIIYRHGTVFDRFKFDLNQGYMIKNNFYPQPVMAVWVLFSPMMSGWVGSRKKFVWAISQKPKDVGSWYLLGTLVRGCRCATSWCDLDSMFDLAVVTLTYKILSGLYIRNHKV